MRLKKPNILVITDRRDLDTQITRTFRACGLPNPYHVTSVDSLHRALHQNSPGRTITSTIFLFDGKRLNEILDGSETSENTEITNNITPDLHARHKSERERAVQSLAVADSHNWIVLVDECHRTQEELLGAYLRATLPDAIYFGFTGTPVKKNDKNTYANFSPPGEAYLDKYGIDEAVRDEATVEVRYTARLTDWHLEDQAIDDAFERYFAHESADVRNALKERGITAGDLARFEPRVRQIAGDIWEHYRQYVMPDGYKAQIVAIDRRTVVLFKQFLDETITNWYVQHKGYALADAQNIARQYSAPIYSASQNDLTKDGYEDVVKYQLTDSEQAAAIKEFCDPTTPLKFLLVCDKLLTGFDAPVEQAMYLDKPLKDHNLLQAIARTNRRYKSKPYGLIVDYYGVSKNLKEALSAYRSEDVQNALQPQDDLFAELDDLRRKAFTLLAGTPDLHNPRSRFVRDALDTLGTVDRFIEFRTIARGYLNLYAALMPDPRVIVHEPDVKFTAEILITGTSVFELKEADLDFKAYSEKIRHMLTEHMRITGITEMCTLRPLDDPMFWNDFQEPPRDLQTAAVRKLTELKKIIYDKTRQNESRYEKFSERLRELIASFQLDLFAIDAADKDARYTETLKELEQLARDIESEEQAHSQSGLDPATYDIWTILNAYTNTINVELASQEILESLALAISEIYTSDEDAIPQWQDKSELRQRLRRKVRTEIAKAKIDDDAWKVLPDKIEQYALKHYAK